MARSLRGYDAKAASEAVQIFTGEETLVQQHYAAEVDINTIVRRYGSGQNMPFGPRGPAVYGDFTGITDYQQALQTIERADAAFMSLPAEVRAKFANDPAKLIEFAQSIPEEEFLGMFEDPAPAAPIVPVVRPGAAAAAAPAAPAAAAAAPAGESPPA